jgi:queuine/archaeosine tRNA-ribosyltransferase
MRNWPQRGMLVNTFLSIIIERHPNGISLSRTTNKAKMTKIRNHYARVLSRLLGRDSMWLLDVVGKDIVTVLQECVKNKKTADSKAAKVQLFLPSQRRSIELSLRKRRKGDWKQTENMIVVTKNYCGL